MNRLISIVTDTGTDMVAEDAEKLGVQLIPLTVRFGDEEFFDGVNLSRKEFYTRLESKQIPKTSQITPYRYMEVFQKEIDKGNEVICLTLSSKISGCYQSAINAAKEFEGKVHVIDTLHFCGSEYVLVCRAVQLREQGLQAQEIVDILEKEKKEVRIIAIFDTLEYLKLGGRISASAATIGNFLAIKPVLRITDGAVDIVAKVRGGKAGNKFLEKYITQDGGIDFSLPMVFSYSGYDNQRLTQFIEDSGQLFENQDLGKIEQLVVGSTIGTYTGPDAISIAYYPKNR